MKYGLKSISYTNPKIQTTLLSKESNNVSFSEDKINVIIGPNGSGKSTLIKDLATRFFCLDRGYTSLDRDISERRYYHCFKKKWETWGDYIFMEDPKVFTSNCAAVYWHPGFKFGGWDMDTAAMMCGYSEEVRIRDKQIRNKSSGQGIYNQLDYIFEVLEGERELTVNIPEKPSFTEYKEKLEAITPLFTDCHKNKTIVLLDEPEQSLDAFKEVYFWDRLLDVNTDNVQVIIATHSIYPLINPKFEGKLNIIETTCDERISVIDMFHRLYCSK